MEREDQGVERGWSSESKTSRIGIPKIYEYAHRANRRDRSGRGMSEAGSTVDVPPGRWTKTEDESCPVWKDEEEEVAEKVCGNLES